jgi:creatinine amidohydrolase
MAGDHPLLLANMTQPDAAVALQRGTAIIVTGSVEQHGGHLPLGTDHYAALTIGLRVADRIQAPVFPLTAVGVAPYHLSWPGTLTVRPQTMIDLMVDVAGGLAAAGATKLLVVNWHEGNTPTVRLAADEIQRAYPIRVVIAETHIITNSLFPEEMEFTHAGSMETAAVLAHDEGLVDLDRMLDGDPVEIGTDGHALFRRRDVFPILRDFREVAATGWYGTPGSVSPERARQIMDDVADHVVASFEDIVAALEQRVAIIGEMS